MAASTSTPYKGYPQPVGNKRRSLIDRTGPTSYVNGTGEVISVKAFGLSNLDKVIGGPDTTGVYYAVAYKGSGSRSSTWTLKWYTLSGMTEVANTTNLSAVIAQIEAIGF